jgi:ribosome biogenesis GTPase
MQEHDLQKGTIIRGVGGFYYVTLHDGRIAECSLRGRLRKLDIKPAVGDYVEVSLTGDTLKGGAIEGISPRKNMLIRPKVANVDQICIVIAATAPEPDFYLVDKLIAHADFANIDVLIIVNKTDLLHAEKYAEIYKNAGYLVYLVSAKTNEGMDELKRVFEGKTTVLAGNSGVGKSSILRTFGLDVKIGDISKIERGKHTTRECEILTACGGLIIDTPGFSTLDVCKFSKEELIKAFHEFAKYDECKFKDCAHINVEDCNIIAAVDAGAIAKSRYESYCEMYKMVSERTF